jgi:hypothetical protein
MLNCCRLRRCAKKPRSAAKGVKDGKTESAAGVLEKRRNLTGDENMSNDSRKSVVSDEHGRIIEYQTTEYFDDGSSKTTHQEAVRGDGGIVDILCGPSPGRITGESYHSPDGASKHYKR